MLQFYKLRGLTTVTTKCADSPRTVPSAAWECGLLRAASSLSEGEPRLLFLNWRKHKNRQVVLPLSRFSLHLHIWWMVGICIRIFVITGESRLCGPQGEAVQSPDRQTRRVVKTVTKEQLHSFNRRASGVRARYGKVARTTVQR